MRKIFLRLCLGKIWIISIFTIGEVIQTGNLLLLIIYEYTWSGLKRAVLEEKQDRKMEVLNGWLSYSEGDRLFVRILGNARWIKTVTRKENDYGRELYCDKRLTVYSCTGRMISELQQILLSVGKRWRKKKSEMENQADTKTYAYVKVTFENFVKRFDNLDDMRAVLDRQSNLSNE